LVSRPAVCVGASGAVDHQRFTVVEFNDLPALEGARHGAIAWCWPSRMTNYGLPGAAGFHRVA
jgi:hypothetical protein